MCVRTIRNTRRPRNVHLTRLIGEESDCFTGLRLLSSERYRIPILSQSIPDGIRPGTIFVVEFDPDSQWLSVATTIVARNLQEDGHPTYLALVRPPEEVESALSALGVDVRAVIKAGHLVIDDWYTASLTGGRIDSEPGKASLFEPIEGGSRVRSLKIADLSVEWLKFTKEEAEPAPGELVLVDSCSPYLRFNEEKPFVEWMESRVNPNQRRNKNITMQGFARGVHSEWLYKRMEAASDGVIDIRVIEREDKVKDFLRVRSLKGQPRDSSWHEIEVKPNGEAVLVN